MADPFRIPSRRSVVHSTDGIVACSQPLAARCGLNVLRAGGNAADAAVAVAAGLNVTEPASTGIGGDMFLLFWDAAAGRVRGLNGSGRSGARCSLDAVRAALGLPAGAPGSIPMTSAHAVTVPGAAAGWVDAVERFGSGALDMAAVLAPAIRLAEQGFPVSELTSRDWSDFEPLLRAASPNFAEMLKRDPAAKDGARPPRPGEMLKNPALARTFRALAAEGKPGFYTGRVADEIVRAVGHRGGLLELADLQHHLDTGSQPTQPISLRFRGQGLGDAAGLELWEHPPNGQGIVALMALGILQELEKQASIPTFGPADFNSAPYLHAVIEALRLAFADAAWFVTDPDVADAPRGLLSEPYLAARARLFDPARAAGVVEHGSPSSFASPALQSCDTVYFTVTDRHGNAASFINSNYGAFGTGIVPRGCGFTLQCRGANFSLDSRHPNRLEPRKRPYHTIIPAIVTNLADGSLHSAFGVMGGFMQPQGHVQVLLAQVVARLGPQQALDAPRVCIKAAGLQGGSDVEWSVDVEDGMPPETVDGLRKLGHRVTVVRGADRLVFGRGQMVRRSVDPVEGTPVWSAGSDMRADGAAYPV